MPTVEIAIFDADKVEIDLNDYRMAIRVDHKLSSHGGLFVDEFDGQDGVMLHLGNEDFKEEDFGFWGSDLIDWDSTDNDEIEIPIIDTNKTENDWGAGQEYLYQFDVYFRIEIDKLLRMAIRQTRSNKIAFLTEYQFGPKNGSKRIVYSIREFWELHDEQKLTFNTMYEMYKA